MNQREAEEILDGFDQKMMPESRKYTAQGYLEAMAKVEPVLKAVKLFLKFHEGTCLQDKCREVGIDIIKQALWDATQGENK